MHRTPKSEVDETAARRMVLYLINIECPFWLTFFGFCSSFRPWVSALSSTVGRYHRRPELKPTFLSTFGGLSKTVATWWSARMSMMPRSWGAGNMPGGIALLAGLDHVDQVVVASAGDLPGRVVNDLLKTFSETLRSHDVGLRLHHEQIDTGGTRLRPSRSHCSISCHQARRQRSGPGRQRRWRPESGSVVHRSRSAS